MKSFLVPTFTQITTLGTIILIFTNSVLFEREVTCTCRKGKKIIECGLYIALPGLILMFLVFWRDKNSFSTCIYICSKHRPLCSCKCWNIVLIFLKAIVVGLLWVVAVLLDGDWYACCWNGWSGENAKIPCKKTRTSEEQVKVDELKNLSKIIGLSTLLGLVGGLFILSLLSKCCNNCSCFLNGKDLYEVVRIKEKKDLLNEIFKERAKENLKAEFLQREQQNQGGGMQLQSVQGQHDPLLPGHSATSI